MFTRQNEEKAIMAAQEYPQAWIIHACFLISSRQETLHAISYHKDEQILGEQYTTACELQA